MVKAEVISNEQDRSQNWHGRSQALISPGRTTALIVITAMIALLVVITHDSNNSIVPKVNSQPAVSNSLQVKPLQDTSATIPTATPVQAATTNSYSNNTSSNDAANALGASATPSLNTANNPSAASGGQSQASDQSQLNGKNLSGSVQ